eukprot:m.9733 g.9733  ORF g.9733 m.9733 type:complete len:375 (-) comp3536_c0_seq1:91-1215(-)
MIFPFLMGRRSPLLAASPLEAFNSNNNSNVNIDSDDSSSANKKDLTSNYNNPHHLSTYLNINLPPSTPLPEITKPTRLSPSLERIRRRATNLLTGSNDVEFGKLMEEGKRGGDVELRDMVARTMLMIAALKGKLPAVKRLVMLGANPSSTDQYGGSALEFAARNNHPHIVQYLVEKCALDPNGTQYSVYGFRPLHKAVAFGQMESVEMLLRLGADVNLRTGDITAPPSYLAQTTHETPLCLATRLRRHGVMHVILGAQKRCDIDACDDNGNNPLRHAIKNKDFRAIWLLLAHGATLENNTSIESNLNSSNQASNTSLEKNEHFNTSDDDAGKALIKKETPFPAFLGYFVSFVGNTGILKRTPPNVLAWLVRDSD